MPPEIGERIVELALKHQAWVCNRLEGLLNAEGISISKVTIQKILIKHNLRSRYERWLALEKRYAKEKIELTKEQIAFIEKPNLYSKSVISNLLVQESY